MQLSFTSLSKNKQKKIIQEFVECLRIVVITQQVVCQVELSKTHT